MVCEIPTPAQFDEASRLLGPDDLDRSVRVSTDLQRHAAWLHEYAAAGLDQLILHNVGSNQAAFIHAFGTHVLPQLRTG